MERNDIEKIYSREKDNLLINLSKDNNPLAVLLGGQSASGKGAIVDFVINEHPDKSFLIVNGDNYRIYHPQYKELIKNDILNFSEKTQAFSNVFTENLINDAIANKYNIIIEGTMRNADTSINTANLFKNNGYNVEAHVIATNPLLSEINLYCRYAEEVSKFGAGRLADVKIHNQASRGMNNTADDLFRKKAVDKITIYTPSNSSTIGNNKNFILQKEKELIYNGKEWNSMQRPSVHIDRYRDEQENNPELLNKFLNNGTVAQQNINNKDVSKALSTALENLEMQLHFVSKKGLSR